jgi:hypothetical protein
LPSQTIQSSAPFSISRLSSPVDQLPQRSSRFQHGLGVGPELVNLVGMDAEKVGYHQFHP